MSSMRSIALCHTIKSLKLRIAMSRPLALARFASPALAPSPSPSQDAQVVDQRTPPLAGECERSRDALAGRSRDRKRKVSLATEAERRHARSVLHEQRGVHDTAHAGHVS